MNQSELLSKIQSLDTSVNGLADKITSLKTAVEAAGNTTPEVDAALAALESHIAAVGAA